MSESEIIEMYNEMLKFFGKLPNFTHHPLQFAHCVKVFKYYKQRNTLADTTEITE